MNIGLYKDTLAARRGADVAVCNLADGLSERGHAVTLFERSELPRQNWRRYDILISSGTNEIRDLAAIDGLPPIIQQFHTDPAYSFRHWIRRWRRCRATRVALRKVAAIQVLREPFREALTRLGIHPPRVDVIGNWAAYIPPAQQDQPFTEHKTIICPGAINRDKNQRLLVQAFNSIAQQFPDWEVHLYGSGKPDFALGPRVRLMGYADLARPYAECAFVAFPSKTEGFPLALVDAAAFGKPALAIQDWIGCGEIVGANVREYAAGLVRLMSDADYRHALGTHCRSYCAEHYARAKILDLWEDLLRAVADTVAPVQRETGSRMPRAAQAARSQRDR